MLLHTVCHDVYVFPLVLTLANVCYFGCTRDFSCSREGAAGEEAVGESHVPEPSRDREVVSAH